MVIRLIAPQAVSPNVFLKCFHKVTQQNLETGRVAVTPVPFSPFSPSLLGSSPTGGDSCPLVSPSVSFG